MNKIFLGIAIIALIGINFYTYVSVKENSNSSTSVLSMIASASAESSTNYEYESSTQETETTPKGGMICSRTRSKTDCEGSGETLCTPHGWTNWSEWSCN